MATTQHRGLALVVLALGLASPFTASAQDDADLPRAVSGEWRLAERDAEAQIDRAVERATHQMNVFIRGIARSRIGESVNADVRVRVDARGGHVVIAMGDQHPIRLPLNGRVVRTRNADGAEVRVRAMVAHRQLTIEESTDQGTRVLYLQRRGDALVLSTRIRSDRLPEDIVYRLRYERAGEARLATR